LPHLVYYDSRPARAHAFACALLLLRHDPFFPPARQHLGVTQLGAAGNSRQGMGMTQARAAVVCGCYLASRPHGRCSCRREHVWRKAPREHRGKCGGRARQPRGQLTGCLWELPPAFACRGSHAPPRSGACRLTARHGGANSAQGTQGAPRKMQRQGAATPGSTHRVSVGCAPSLRLPRQPQTAPLRRLPPAPLPSALRLKNNNNNNVQRQSSCNRQ